MPKINFIIVETPSDVGGDWIGVAPLLDVTGTARILGINFDFTPYTFVFINYPACVGYRVTIIWMVKSFGRRKTGWGRKQ
jgi:hypothetical protein